MIDNILEIKNLTKKFNNNVVVDSININVENGKIYSLLGRNGAGKSTLLKMLTTVILPSSGDIYMDKINVLKNPLEARMRFGYVSQEPSVDDTLTARENLYLQSRLCHYKGNIISRIDELLTLLNLQNEADKIVSKFSGGMKKRLEIGCALISVPKVLYLDEPTLGLDVQSRNELLEYIKMINHNYKTTIFLTTHYLEEADRICDSAIIIDKGKVIIQDSPQNLKDSIGKQIVYVSLKDHSEENYLRLKESMYEHLFTKKVKNIDGVISIILDSAYEEEIDIYKIIECSGIEVVSISIKEINLYDVYLHYTGKNFSETNQKS